MAGPQSARSFPRAHSLGLLLSQKQPARARPPRELCACVLARRQFPDEEASLPPPHINLEHGAGEGFA